MSIIFDNNFYSEGKVKDIQSKIFHATLPYNQRLVMPVVMFLMGKSSNMALYLLTMIQKILQQHYLTKNHNLKKKR